MIASHRKKSFFLTAQKLLETEHRVEFYKVVGAGVKRHAGGAK